jgi:hypothetical protein
VGKAGETCIIVAVIIVINVLFSVAYTKEATANGLDLQIIHARLCGSTGYASAVLHDIMQFISNNMLLVIASI